MARLRRIDNGREYVTPEGQIKGILAADSPQEVVGGVWTRPTLTLFQRSTVGLTGVSGRIWKSYSLGPFGAAALFALRCTLFRMPEPDIQIPVGAELSLSMLDFPKDAPVFERPEPSPVPSELADFLEGQPFGVTKSKGRPAKDIVNLAFEGTGEQVVRAFRAAGWTMALPLSGQSFIALYTAFTAKRGFASAPASKLKYQGQDPDFVFEKSLNSIALRHHVRIWRASADGREIWLAAATRDIGMSFDPRAVKFAHRIDSHIDWERNKIADDLVFAGCAEPPGFVDRPDAGQSIYDGGGISTDGRLAFLQLGNCAEPLETARSDRPRPVGPFVARMARRVILETRQYVERENTFFWTYRAFKWGRAARKTSADSADEN